MIFIDPVALNVREGMSRRARQLLIASHHGVEDRPMHDWEAVPKERYAGARLVGKTTI